ncbi:hypothetical protein BGX23_011386 [Mortierella sp. AD031]|nr:hypothetical protein BGX23_011386 [Mortierella sp. AD031]
MVFKVSLSILIVATLAMLCALAPQAEAHSWADCVDWKPAGKSNRWTKGKCMGYARRFPVKQKPFGKLDSASPSRHYEQLNSKKNNYKLNDEPACSDHSHGESRGADERREKKNIGDAYNQKGWGQMTSTTAGDTLCLRWPAKNHAQDTDKGKVIINWMRDDGKENHRQSVLNKHKLTELDFGNCDKGSSDTRACGGCIKVPKNATPGMYLLQWRWRLNKNPDEFYTSCADIKVNKK